MRYLYLLMAVICCCWGLNAQIVLIPLPTVTESFRLEDVWHLQALVSGSNPVAGSLTAHIEDNSHNLVYEATLPNLTLRSGLNSIQQMNAPGATTTFGQNSAATILRQTGSLPYGEFIICYFLNDAKSIVLGEYCYEKGVKPMLPPELLQPYDQEEVSTLSPLLVWKAPFPTSSAPLTYALRLTEVKNGQNAGEALEKNAPLISRQYRDQTQLLYPGDAPALQDGKTYAWRISVSTGDYHVGTTDTWQFTVKQEKIRPRNDSYRVLNDKPDGNVYIIKNGMLRFAYNNRYGMDTLDYSIKPLSEATNKSINQLPVIKMAKGMNKVDIDLVGVNQIEEGKKYLIQIHQKNGNHQYLEFIYRKGR